MSIVYQGRSNRVGEAKVDGVMKRGDMPHPRFFFNLKAYFG